MRIYKALIKSEPTIAKIFFYLLIFKGNFHTQVLKIILKWLQG